MKKKNSFSNEGPDRLNVIVNGSKLTGDFAAESSLRIDGEIEGNVTSKSKVVIGETGRIKGDLVCVDADVEGKVEGQVVVQNLLSMRSKSVILGEVTTSKLQIEEGATLTGMCNMSGASISAANKQDLVY